MAKKSLYKEFFVAKNEEEVTKYWHLLVDKGYDPFDIYVFRYQGKDGAFHREVFVFNRDTEPAG